MLWEVMEVYVCTSVLHYVHTKICTIHGDFHMYGSTIRMFRGIGKDVVVRDGLKYMQSSLDEGSCGQADTRGICTVAI